MSLSTTIAGMLPAAQASPKAGSSSAMDYDAFLRLLIAEMQNQDPTSPKDPTEYISQFATFANVEQSMQVNNKLEAILMSFSLSQADGVIGRQLTTADGKISGIVVSRTIGPDGQMIATLDTDEKVVLGPGVTISDPVDSTPGPEVL